MSSKLVPIGAPLQWRVMLFRTRASGSLKVMSEPEARGPEEHEVASCNSNWRRQADIF